MLRYATIAVFAFLAHASGTVAAEPSQDEGQTIADRVDTHLERGIEFYAERQYELAIVEFRAGFEIDPRPEFLFALAQAERLSGDCPTAVIYYRRYLMTDIDKEQAEAARVNMRRCTRALESGIEDKEPAPEKTPAPEPAVESPRAAESTISEPATNTGATALLSKGITRRQPWYADKIGLSLIASGSALVAVGGGFWMSSGAASNRANNAEHYDQYSAEIETARRARGYSYIGLGLGSAVLAGSIYYYIRKSSPAESSPMLSATIERDRAGVLFVGRF